nr:hyphally-regulated protein-like isoform X2 [Lepeophtheirus salmonis]
MYNCIYTKMEMFWVVYLILQFGFYTWTSSANSIPSKDVMLLDYLPVAMSVRAIDENLEKDDNLHDEEVLKMSFTKIPDAKKSLTDKAILSLDDEPAKSDQLLPNSDSLKGLNKEKIDDLEIIGKTDTKKSFTGKEFMDKTIQSVATLGYKTTMMMLNKNTTNCPQNASQPQSPEANNPTNASSPLLSGSAENSSSQGGGNGSDASGNSSSPDGSNGTDVGGNSSSPGGGNGTDAGGNSSSPDGGNGTDAGGNSSSPDGGNGTDAGGNASSAGEANGTAALFYNNLNPTNGSIQLLPDTIEDPVLLNATKYMKMSASNKTANSSSISYSMMSPSNKTANSSSISYSMMSPSNKTANSSSISYSMMSPSNKTANSSSISYLKMSPSNKTENSSSISYSKMSPSNEKANKSSIFYSGLSSVNRSPKLYSTNSTYYSKSKGVMGMGNITESQSSEAANRSLYAQIPISEQTEGDGSIIF